MGPFFEHGLTLNLVWIINHLSSNVHRWRLGMDKFHPTCNRWITNQREDLMSVAILDCWSGWSSNDYSPHINGLPSWMFENSLYTGFLTTWLRVTLISILQKCTMIFMILINHYVSTPLPTSVMWSIQSNSDMHQHNIPMYTVRQLSSSIINHSLWYSPSVRSLWRDMYW